MKSIQPFSERASFFWAFIFNRRKRNRRRARVLPANYMPTVSVVIPALNEAENLPYVLPLLPEWIDETILVDGKSTDGTAEVARQLLPQIHIVQQPSRGKGDALRAGFAAATGDIIVMLDADGSTNPGEILTYLSALLGGADFAKGSRFARWGGTADMPLHRKLGNACFVMLVRLLFGGSYTDLCYGYNAFWADVLPALHLTGDGFEIETLINVRALQAGLKVVEVPSFEDKRRYGSSRLRTIPDGWRVLKTIFQEWQRPWRESPLAAPARSEPAIADVEASGVASLPQNAKAEVV